MGGRLRADEEPCLPDPHHRGPLQGRRAFLLGGTRHHASWKTGRRNTPFSELWYCCSVAQLCPALFDLMDCSPPGSSVHGILQVKIVEQVAFPHLWDLPDPGIEPASPSLAGSFFTPEPPGKPIFRTTVPYMHPESP